MSFAKKPIYLLLVAILTLSSPLFSPVIAHDIIDAPWMIVNGQDLTRYNPLPAPTNFPLFERVVAQTFTVGSKVNFKINIEAFSNELNLSMDSLSATFEILGNTVNTTEFDYTFESNGIYIFAITVLSGNEEIFADTLGAYVGEQFDAPTIKFGERTVSSSSSSYEHIIEIDPDQSYMLSIVDPNPNSEYRWDLMDKGVINNQQLKLSFDKNSKFPQTIILEARTSEGSIAYNYLTLRSDKENNSIGAPPPPSVAGDQDVNLQTTSSFAIWGPLLALIITVGASLYLFRGKYEKE